MTPTNEEDNHQLVSAQMQVKSVQVVQHRTHSNILVLCTKYRRELEYFKQGPPKRKRWVIPCKRNFSHSQVSRYTLSSMHCTHPSHRAVHLREGGGILKSHGMNRGFGATSTLPSYISSSLL